ncbi:hypothetical protein PIROE2DRAFT_44620 [Piromyces sp. E2]|nr:hypothetical protein PIROE2DRAFT_44620 [Piromyces sp. E2]|eukprot:OUM62109.1 hypothetical protein PIROE2DRAFT_44620 [Piromyces sp. E2]
MSLKKLENPKSVMIISKAQDNHVIRLTQQLVYWLVMSPKSEEQEVRAAREIHIYIDGNLAQNPIFNYDKLLKIHPDFRRLLHFWTPQFCAETPGLYDLIDFIITLGGDGTVLYASWLFQNSQVPPVIPIHMGSLGFFTVFNFNYVFNILSRLLSNRDEQNKNDDDKDDDNKSDGSSSYPSYLNNFKCKTSPYVGLENHRSSSEEFYSEDNNKLCFNNLPTETFHILNDVVVDRGPSAYMSHMELYGNNRHLTTVQADGLVVATPTGSTAYSLSAGGPIVHPQVQTMIVTPICPHTLSFRPMLLPNDLELKIMVPKDSRNTAWASFDGRHRIELKQGDFITVTSSRYPMPTICLNGQSNDWYNSLRRCLKWNDRVRQKAFTSSDNYIPGPITVNALKSELDDAMKSIMENAAALNQTNTNGNANGEGSESVAFEEIPPTHPINSFFYNSYDPNSRFSDNDLLYHTNLSNSNLKNSENLGAKVSYHDIGFV